MMQPKRYDDVPACVEDVLQAVGKRVVLGIPLGVGKPNHFVNELYRRAREDPSIDLRILTALTLERPRWNGELERRLVQPISDRLFGDYPDLDYALDIRRGELPPNVEVAEFYLSPGAFLGVPAIQQSYVSSNYSHVVRDALDAGVNVVAQLVSPGTVDGEPRLSLGSNPDIALDLVPHLRERERAGFPVAVVGQVNENMPFVYGDAVVPPEMFDAILDAPGCRFRIFGPPNVPVSTADYAIGLHASALVRDGGTLQLGIGSLGDAIARLLVLRDGENETYRRLLKATGADSRFAPTIERIGGTAPFREGLYAATEMFVPGFVELYRRGILRRRVYPHLVVQQLRNEGRIGDDVSIGTLRTLVACGVVDRRPDAEGIDRLHRLGVLRDTVRLDNGSLAIGPDLHVPADLEDPATLDALEREGLGDELRGSVAHASFFLGPQSFYEALRSMERFDLERIAMTGISFVNELYGDEALKRLQRRNARFLNTTMMMTLTGAAVSDGLADGRVVSGVGGQYNFVAMAQALDDGRSVILLRSTREKHGRVRSNIVWSYGHVTIPRHLRDLVVTEYGIADIRGKTDREVIAALLEITDSRFQDELLQEAKRAGKIPHDHRIRDPHRRNLPEILESALAPSRDVLPEFPFGTDLTPTEVTLGRALRSLQDEIEGRTIPPLSFEGIRTALFPSNAAKPYLERMGLDQPQTLQEHALRGILLYALALEGAL